MPCCCLPPALLCCRLQTVINFTDWQAEGAALDPAARHAITRMLDFHDLLKSRWAPAAAALPGACDGACAPCCCLPRLAWFCCAAVAVAAGVWLWAAQLALAL